MCLAFNTAVAEHPRLSVSEDDLTADGICVVLFVPFAYASFMPNQSNHKSSQ